RWGDVERSREAWRAARARGVPGLVLTNGRGGRLGEDAPPTVSLDIPALAPFLCGTSTYTGTVLTLLLLLRGAAASDQTTAGADAAWRPSPTAIGDAIQRLPAEVPP